VQQWTVSALAGCVLPAGRATSEVAAQLRHCGMTGRLLGSFGALSPESLSERLNANRTGLSLRALETPPTAMTLALFSRQRLVQGWDKFNHIPCTDRQSRLPPITQGNLIENH